MTDFRTLFFFHNFSKIRIHFPWTFFWIHSLWNFSKIRIHPRKNSQNFLMNPLGLSRRNLWKFFPKSEFNPFEKFHFSPEFRLWKFREISWIQTLKNFQKIRIQTLKKFRKNFLNSCSLNSTKIWIQTTSGNLTWHDVTWRQFPGKKVKGAKMANSWTST